MFKRKSNRSNTLKKFYDSKREEVEKLNFFSTKHSLCKNNIHKLYNLKMSTNNLKANNQINKSIEIVETTFPQISQQLNFRPLESNTKELINRFENISYENMSKNSITEIQKTINNLKQVKHSKEKRLKELIEIVTNIQLEIEAIESCTKKTLEIQLQKEPKSSHRQSRANIEHIVFTKINIQFNERKIKIDKANKEKTKIINELDLLKERLDFERNKKRMIIDELSLHYHKLLKIGADTRSDGLIWIIKAIYTLGKKVMISCLPDFLDEQTIIYLFKMTKLTSEKDQIEQEIKTFKQKHSHTNSRNNLSYSKEQYQTYLTKCTHHSIDDDELNMITNNKDRLNPMLTDCNMIPNVLKFEQVLKFIDQQSPKPISEMNSFQQLIAKYHHILKEISLMKKLETKRIFDEFLNNDYERRYSVDKTTVISAVIGEDNLSPELQTQAKTAKIYLDTLKHCKLYKRDIPTTKDSSLHQNRFRYENILTN